MSSSTKLLRKVLSELRPTLDSGLKLKDSRMAGYILDQYRKHQVTERQTCKAAQEMTFMADAYATYLQSQRQWKQVHEEYHKPELTSAQTASRVGFKLPHDPK